MLCPKIAQNVGLGQKKNELKMCIKTSTVKDTQMIKKYSGIGTPHFSETKYTAVYAALDGTIFQPMGPTKKNTTAAKSSTPSFSLRPPRGRANHPHPPNLAQDPGGVQPKI